MPALSNALSSSLPLGPTKTWPARSSSLPGCSPTTSTRADRGPSPNTACVAHLYSAQPRHFCAAARIRGMVGFDGRKSAAEPVVFAGTERSAAVGGRVLVRLAANGLHRLAVLFSLVVLLAIFLEPM